MIGCEDDKIRINCDKNLNTCLPQVYLFIIYKVYYFIYYPF